MTEGYRKHDWQCQSSWISELENLVMMLGYTKQDSACRVAGKVGLAGLAFVTLGLTGCLSAVLPDSATISQVETVTVGDGVTVESPLGAGAASLAHSTWAIHKASDDSLLFRVEFGSDGEVMRIFDSFVFASEWLGSEIVPDTNAHPTDLAGGSYISGAYATEQDDRVGVLGVLHGLLLGTHLGTATLSFSGSLQGDRIDGAMIRTVKIFTETPFDPPGDAEFDAYALQER